MLKAKFYPGFPRVVSGWFGCECPAQPSLVHEKMMARVLAHCATLNICGVWLVSLQGIDTSCVKGMHCFILHCVCFRPVPPSIFPLSSKSFKQYGMGTSSDEKIHA